MDRFCFLPAYGPVSTRQFLFFLLGVPVHFIALYRYGSRSKEGNPDKNTIFWTQDHWTVMFIGGYISAHILNMPSHKDSFFRNWNAYYITQDYTKIIHPPHLSSGITQVCVISSFSLNPARPSLSHRAKTKVWLEMAAAWLYPRSENLSPSRVKADQEERLTVGQISAP